MRYKTIVPIVQQVLADYSNYLPVTIRQVYYQLVTKHVILNNAGAYSAYDRILTIARERNDIDPDSFTDRVRYLLKQDTYADQASFLDGLETAYYANKDEAFNAHVEVWCEKDALADMIYRIIRPYEIPLLVIRGFASYTARHEAAGRINAKAEAKPVKILYLGDHDPSGRGIQWNIEETLPEMVREGTDYTFSRIAITPEQLQQYNLPLDPNPIKRNKTTGLPTDSRAKRFIAEYGEKCWELDALPPNVLKEIVLNAILPYVNVGLLQQLKAKEEEQRNELRGFFTTFKRGEML